MCFFKIRKKANNKYNMLLRSEKNPYFLLQNRGVLPLRTHFVIVLFFNFLEYIGSKENDYIHTLLLELLIFYKVDFFCNQYP